VTPSSPRSGFRRHGAQLPRLVSNNYARMTQDLASAVTAAICLRRTNPCNTRRLHKRLEMTVDLRGEVSVREMRVTGADWTFWRGLERRGQRWRTPFLLIDSSAFFEGGRGCCCCGEEWGETNRSLRGLAHRRCRLGAYARWGPRCGGRAWVVGGGQVQG
jgi:hypothetical protein